MELGSISEFISQLVNNDEVKVEITLKLVKKEPEIIEPEIIRPFLKDGQIKGINRLAEFLGCAPATAQKLKNTKQIPYYERGARLIFYEDEIMDALSALEKKPCFIKTNTKTKKNGKN
jgi:hypothetical protein